MQPHRAVNGVAASDAVLFFVAVVGVLVDFWPFNFQRMFLSSRGISEDVFILMGTAGLGKRLARIDARCIAERL